MKLNKKVLTNDLEKHVHRALRALSGRCDDQPALGPAGGSNSILSIPALIRKSGTLHMTFSLLIDDEGTGAMKSRQSLCWQQASLAFCHNSGFMVLEDTSFSMRITRTWAGWGVRGTGEIY